MSRFHRGDRVRVTNQSSEYRGCAGTVVRTAADGLVVVRFDGSARHSRDPTRVAEQDLGPTTQEDPIDHFVPF